MQLGKYNYTNTQNTSELILSTPLSTQIIFLFKWVNQYFLSLTGRLHVGFMLFTTPLITSWAKIFVSAHILNYQKIGGGAGRALGGGPKVSSRGVWVFRKTVTLATVSR